VKGCCQLNIQLKNIGIIRDSTIELNGLTVITGQNNSGKTTVGKVVYSVIDAASNLERKALIDKRSYIIQHTTTHTIHREVIGSTVGIQMFNKMNIGGSPLTPEVFMSIAAHEFGHALGLWEAYGSAFPYAYNDEIPSSSIMGTSNGNNIVTNNELEMILWAWRTNDMQYFGELSSQNNSGFYYEQSVAVKLPLIRT
jgi:hypothetical protein